jgi:glycyl-tRNA synthetase beta chain
MKQDLLIEIGVEELPASFLEPAAVFFKNTVLEFLQKMGIETGESKVFFTPRRLALLIRQVDVQQQDQVQEIQGPPKSFAFDKENKPTQAAIGFAKTHNLEPTDIYTKVTPKGEYIFIKKEIKARPTSQLLTEFLPDAILAIPFPKTMRWNETKTRFGRPIRWLLALLGPNPIGFAINGVQSGQFTYGHRMANAKPIPIASPQDYEPTLKKHYVIPNFEERKELIRKNLDEIAARLDAKVVEDRELLDESANVVEWPAPLLCQFNREFLALPPIVIITALKAHQRCFSLTKISGEPLSDFIAITNIPKTKSPDVRTWIERMVGSRLADAKFYYDEDLKIGLEKLVEGEKKVTWIDVLGTLSDKTERIKTLSNRIYSYLHPPFTGDHPILTRSCELSKTDLLTNIVREKEFTSLQGTIGGIYAERLGEAPEVVKAISEQYLPKSGEDELPKSEFGAILSIADKLDNIVASFIMTIYPTGSQDPFALRRQANAIIRITDEKNLRFPFSSLVQESWYLFTLFNETDMHPFPNLQEFFKERIGSYMKDKGIRYDVVDAILDYAVKDIRDGANRALALMQFRGREDFVDLVIGQKRVVNILRGLAEPPPVDKSKFVEPEEKTLFDKTMDAEPGLNAALKAEDYLKSMELLLSLRGEIDTFFDKVLVMAEDENLRNNRLALLYYIKSLFLKVADLSKIVLEGAKQ